MQRNANPPVSPKIKSAIDHQPQGIRIGTPAITTRGLKEGDMDIVAKFIVDTFSNSGDSVKLAGIKSDIEKYMESFPIPTVS